MTNEWSSQTVGNPASQSNMQHAELQACSCAYFHVIMQCCASTKPSLVFCQTDCEHWFKATHTLCPLLMLHESTGPMRKSVSQTLFRPLKNVRLPPSQCHKSLSTSSIPKVNVMLYGVLERTRGMLSNTACSTEKSWKYWSERTLPNPIHMELILNGLRLKKQTNKKLFKSEKWIETQLRWLETDYMSSIRNVYM